MSLRYLPLPPEVSPNLIDELVKFKSMTVEDRAVYIRRRNEEDAGIFYGPEQIETKDKLLMLKLIEEKVNSLLSNSSPLFIVWAPLTDERGSQGKNFFTDGKYRHVNYCFWCAVQISPWVVKHCNILCHAI